MTEKTYDFSITKEAINELPMKHFPGNSQVISKKSDIKNAVNQLREEPVLGFDTETRPSFKKGEHYPISLLQLSTAKNAYLFRLRKTSFPSELTELLADDSIIKVGVAIRDDIKGLQDLSKFEPGGFVELADLATKLKVKNLGLRSLAAIFLDFRISKAAKLSNWDNETLTESQISYAATDAWVGREIYMNIKERQLL
jgi:ribonuclease D